MATVAPKGRGHRGHKGIKGKKAGKIIIKAKIVKK